MSLPDPGDPQGIQDNGKYRDFCHSCHVPVEFDRCRYDDGRHGAWCPQCGQPNYWEADDIEDQDTDPQIFSMGTAGAAQPFYSGGMGASQEEIEEAIREFLNSGVDKD